MKAGNLFGADAGGDEKRDDRPVPGCQPPGELMLVGAGYHFLVATKIEVGGGKDPGMLLFT